MKYTYKLLLTGVCALLLLMPNCTNLDEEVYNAVPADEFGKTPAQVNAIVASVYKTLKQVWPGDFFSLIEESSDAAITPTRRGGDWWDGGIHLEMKLHTWTPSNVLVETSWEACTKGIATCNHIYANINSLDFASANMDEAQKTRLLAEIRGVRAFWYYVLIDNFGNGPLVKEYNEKELPSTASRIALFNFVIDELNAIKDVLRSDITTASYGKFTKGAAYTLLAKMYLNAEVWTGVPKWEEVIAACDTVLALGYTLEPNWKDNFEVHNEDAREAIFAVPFGKGDGGNDLHKKSLHYLDPTALGMSYGAENGLSAQPDYVKQFDDADKRKKGSFLMDTMRNFSTGNVLITSHNRPLVHTVDFNIIPATEWEGTQWGQVEQEEGVRVNKWQYEVGLSSSDMDNDYAIFRYTDIYLMKAEALLHLGDNAQATGLINEIRQRGFGDATHNYSSTTLENLYLERRLEFAWENLSRQDMIRFGKFLDPGYWRPNTSPNYRLLFPIPASALRANHNLEQNDGY